MELLEREAQLQQLTAAFDAVAGGGAGRTALVLGEAGVGKTSLVRRLLELRRGRADLYWGACEALFTPRPLGPIGDFAAALPPGLAAQVDAGHTYNGLFPAFVAFLRDRARPILLVIEDAHWADEATLDFIKYVGRRIDGTRALFIVTVREDELALEHPLRGVLGDLPAANTGRLALAPLSRGAVERLAQAAGCDAGALYRSTGGNPFYVSESLAARGEGVPGSVRDAVLARFGRLTPAARRVVELVAVEPGRLARAAVDALAPGADDAVREACAAGVLRAEAGWLAFRHEIARQCVEMEIPGDRRAGLHAALLDHLRASGDGGLAREVHHAVGAGRVADVCALAPRAAAEAARLGSHREAATLLKRALAAGDGLEAGARAGLLEETASELHITGALAEAIELREQALALRRAAGDRLREGVNLRLLGTLHRQASGDKAKYLQYARAAVDVLEPLGAGGELANAYSTLSHVLCLRSEYDAAIDWGERAVALAQASGDAAALALAANRVGTARLYKGDDARARAQLEGALALAQRERFDGLAADIFVSLQTGTLIHQDHAFAIGVGERGIAYCEARDLDGYALSLRVRCAYSHISLGRWEQGERDYAAVLAAPRASALLAATCVYTLRRQQARRGVLPEAARGLAVFATDVDDYWRGVQQDIHAQSVEYRPPAIAAACAEAAWLRGESHAVLDVVRAGLAAATATNEGRLAGPLLVWLLRFGAAPPPFDGELPPANALELSGDRAGAAAVWQRLGMPYDEALVLAFGDAAQMRAALAAFTALGAERAAAATRARLRAAGARGVERGPYGHARSHAFGLTRRESEIAELLRQGLSNAAIAQRLQRSERTIEHHVAGVLSKLGVTSRAQAVARLSNIGQAKEN
jgi:DNA-binding CsgD family transcriptional regulator